MTQEVSRRKKGCGSDEQPGHVGKARNFVGRDHCCLTNSKRIHTI